MQHSFDQLKAIRRSTLQLIEPLSNEELNEVPTGFNNNIIWNMAHLVAAQQGMCYARGAHPMVIADSFFEQYKPGTKPSGPVDDAFINHVKELMLTTVDRLEIDYNNGLFNQNPAWTNRFGVTLHTIEESLQFLTIHEGLHLGYIMAMKKSVGNKRM